MKIYSQGDQAIVVSIEKEVSKDLTDDLLALKHILLIKLSFYYRNCTNRVGYDDLL